MTAPLTKDQRTALVASLRALPAAMREKPHWLMWKYLIKVPGKKPAKVPYYLSGKPRGWPYGKPEGGKPSEQQPQVAQSSDLDRQHLVTFDQAIAALETQPRWQGIGYAFLKGDGLVGVDIDDAISEDGEISDLARMVMRLCPGYIELSPSGRGMHIILAGEVESFKSDEIGLEIYCGHQFFTCTGTAWGDGVAEPPPVDMTAMDLLRARCEQANEIAKQRKAAERAAQQPVAAVAKAPAPKSVRANGEKGQDFQLVNAKALAHLSSWVPELFPGAREYTTEHGSGYRVSSAALNRNLQEDLSLTPGGIEDFGEEVKMSAVDVVMTFKKLSAYEALQWLAPRVGVELKRRAGAASARRPEPPAEGELAITQSAAPPGEDPRPEPSPAPSSSEDATEAPAGKGKGKKEKQTKVNWDTLRRLLDDFVYQYGSDQAWDTIRREPIKITNLRNTFGNDTVRVWMNSADRRVIFAEDVMFEPGVVLPDHQLNLFDGLPLEPEEGDCAVMVELLNHLCSTSEAPGMEASEVADWVLRWCALPLQQLGAKLDTALVFHGPQGTGKNLFFDVVRDLYGEYGVMVGQTELEDKYNTWLSGKMFIIGDEVVSRQEMFHAKNRLKWIVTQRTKIPIRAMHQDTRWESNHANLVFLSNENMPLALEDGDRRYLVVYTPNSHDGDLYQRVHEFLANGGARKFLHFLLTMDLGDFNEHSKPPLTKAKSTLIELGYKPAERFMSEWLAGYLPLPMQPCSAEQLYRCFRRWADANGERFPPKQADFTEQAKRFVNERLERDEKGARMPPRLIYKVVQLKQDPGDGGSRRAVRCWLPRGTGPRELAPEEAPQDTAKFRSEGEWVAYCVRTFEKEANRFLRRTFIPDEEAEHAAA